MMDLNRAVPIYQMKLYTEILSMIVNGLGWTAPTTQEIIDRFLSQLLLLFLHKKYSNSFFIYSLLVIVVFWRCLLVS
jgi:hypothetical protein